MSKINLAPVPERKITQCYICGGDYSKREVSDGDVITYDGRRVHVEHKGVPKSAEWVAKNKARLEAKRLEQEKRDEEIAAYDDEDWR